MERTTKEALPLAPADRDLADRLYDWRFRRAADLLRTDHPNEVVGPVRALAAVFGDMGWMVGADPPAMEVIVGTVVDSVLARLVETHLAAPPPGTG